MAKIGNFLRPLTITGHPVGCQTTLSPPSLRKYFALYDILAYFKEIPRSLIKALKEG